MVFAMFSSTPSVHHQAGHVCSAIRRVRALQYLPAIGLRPNVGPQVHAESVHLHVRAVLASSGLHEREPSPCRSRRHQPELRPHAELGLHLGPLGSGAVELLAKRNQARMLNLLAPGLGMTFVGRRLYGRAPLGWDDGFNMNVITDTEVVRYIDR